MPWTSPTAKHFVAAQEAGLITSDEYERIRDLLYAGTMNPAAFVSSAQLYTDLEQVLRDKGASDAWLEHAMPDLHTAAMQFAFSQYGAGHRDACTGKELPNPGPDDKPLLIVTETDGSRWMLIDDTDRAASTMIPAPLPAGMADTPEARQRLQAMLFTDHLSSSAGHDD